ncbi:MAG: pyrroline-5-carboxylate reductase [Gammaproteobacteria bacterium]
MRNIRRIAFIGGGNMAQSLVGGLIAAGHAAETIAIAEPDPTRRERLKRYAGASITADNAEVVAGATLVVLAVKPQVVPKALAEAAATLAKERPTLLSIAAGVRIAAITAAVGAELPVVRAMPNTPALIGRGASAFYANAATDEASRRLAREVLESVGIAIEVEEEAQLDAVTAVSGSGPAYFFLLVEALARAGIAAGLPTHTAERLAAATGAGAMALLDESGETPAALRERVTSPGGTTAAALDAFESKGFEAIVEHAVRRAVERSRELGDMEH